MFRFVSFRFSLYYYPNKDIISWLFHKRFIADKTAITDDGTPVTPEDILIFFTGADQPPPLGFASTPRLMFSEDTLASASTCALRLTLPIQHQTYESFKYSMILSLMGHG